MTAAHMTPPILPPGNAAVRELREWLEWMRENARDQLEHGDGLDDLKIRHAQGRLSILRELLAVVDETRLSYGDRVP